MTTIDEIGRRAAITARADADELARARLDWGLEQLRAGEAPVVAVPPQRVQPRRFVALAATLGMAAAAVVAVVVYANHGSRASVVPATEPGNSTTSVVDSTPPDTEPALAERGSNAIAVDYQALPSAFDAFPFATLNDQGARPLVAIGDTRIVTVAGSVATLIDPFSPGADREPLQLDVAPVESLAAGPGDVLYGFVRDGDSQMSIVAIALSGDRAGQVLASAPVSRQFTGDVVTNTGVLGHGPDGIIDRLSGQQLLGYVDETGSPRAFDRPAHTVATISGEPTNGGDVVIRDPDGLHDWQLSISNDPSLDLSLVASVGPFPSSHGGAVLHIPIDGTNTVIAVLASDGTGEWYTLAGGWQLAASDVDGTILMRVGGGAVELARLDPPQRIDFLDQSARPHQRPIFAETLPTSVTTATPCTIDDLDVQPVLEPAMGTIYGSLLVRNKGADVCQVSGPPDVALLDTRGGVAQSADPVLLSAPATQTVVLEPDSWARAELGPVSSNVCGGTASSQLRFSLDGTSITVPLEVTAAAVDNCIPPENQGGPGAMQVQPYQRVEPSSVENPFNHLHFTIRAPESVRAGDVLRYDVVIGSQAADWVLPADTCPIYQEALFADVGATDQPPTSSAQLLLNCGDGVSIKFGEQVVFHMELEVPADAEPGPATLTWTPVEPECDGATALITII